MSETYTLSRPLKTHDGEVMTITINEPSARSFFEHGEPFKTRFVAEGDQERIEFDYNNAVMKKFLSDMTGIDDLILGSLRTKDYLHIRSIATNLVWGSAGPNPPQT